mgnify:CR=1 FL=1
MGNKPRIRFKGFTEDWEQRKLGDLTQLITKGTTPKVKNIQNGINFIKVENISDDGVISINSYVSEEEHMNYLSRSILSNDDILFSIAGTLGRTAIVKSHLLPANTNQALAIIRLNKSVDVEYINTFLKSNAIKTYIRKNPTVGAQPNLSLGQVSDLEINIPSYSEQKKISNLFSNFDLMITLHQCKLEKLKLTKKALLQKLFPKNGKDIPEIRFKGFIDAWEQRKADYIFKSVTDKGYPELPVLSASQELGMVYREQNGIDIQHDKKNEASYKRVLPGQFVIHLRSFQGGFAYSEVDGITSPAYTVMSFKNSNEQYGLFWKHIFKSETFIKRLETITYGIRDGRSISFSDFKSLILQYPSFSEQKMIGDSIAIIERGITLHQRKLERLQEVKKGLLQKMFV